MDPYDGRVVTNLIRQALAGEPLTLYGDGRQTRSFQYVDDLVEGVVRLMDADVHEPVNLGNPVEFTMLELADLVLELTGSRSPLTIEPLPIDDPQQRQPDITLARAAPRLGAARAPPRRPCADHPGDAADRVDPRRAVRVLVTGGAGYIGSHTAKALALAGDEPVVLDDLRTGHRANVRWGPLVEASLDDREAIRRTLRDERIEAVIHFAASAYVGDSDARSARLFPQQRDGHPVAPRRDARRGRRPDRLQLDLRHLRHPGPRADRRGAAAAADEPVRRVEAVRRAVPCAGTRRHTAFAGPPCATSMPPAPTPMASSARSTIPRPT